MSHAPGAGVSAVMLDLTVRAPTAAGHIVAYQTGAPRPATATASFTTGEARSSRAVVALGDGQISIFNASAGSLTVAVDVTGWFTDGTAAPDSGGTYYVALPASRIADARYGIGDLGILAPNYSADQGILGRSGVPDGTGAAFPVAAVATLTALSPAASGYIKLGLPGWPITSNAIDLSFTAHRAATNMIVAPLPEGRLILDNVSDGDTPVVLDVFGYFALPTVPLPLDKIPATQWAPNAAEISATGRYLTITTGIPLVPGDTNGVEDVFLLDRATGSITRASVDSRGEAANGPSYTAVVSDDGRYVAFTSTATNLVSGDDDSHTDVFVRDTVAGTTVKISRGLGGQSINQSIFPNVLSMTADGSQVVFASAASNLVADDNNAIPDVFVADVPSGELSRVSVSSQGVEGNAASGSPSYTIYNATAVITADGRYVAFFSYATNLVTGDTNNIADVFVHDRATHTTTREDVSATGEQSYGSWVGMGSMPGSLSMSDEGRFIVFASRATNLVPDDASINIDVFIRDRVAGTTTRIAPTTGRGSASMGRLSTNGSTILFDSTDPAFSLQWPANPYTTLYRMDLATRSITPIRGYSFIGPYYFHISRDGTHAIIQALGNSYVLKL